MPGAARSGCSCRWFRPFAVRQPLSLLRALTLPPRLACLSSPLDALLIN